MEIAVCAQCGKENQLDIKNKNCSECGAALIPRRLSDTNGNGRVDFKDVKAAGKNLIGISMLLGVKSVFRRQAEKDLASVNDLADSFKKFPPDNRSESQRKLEQFAGALRSTIELKIAERMAGKPDGKWYLEYTDAQILTASVHNIFMNALSFTPRQVSAACALSKAILAPSKQEQKNLVKAAIGFSGGTVGIGMIISSVGVALGWGAGTIATITAVFVGSSIAGPIMWCAGGLCLLFVAGYLAKTSSKEVDSERFTKVLKMATEKAVEAIWSEHGEKLSESVDEIRYPQHTN